ncbi:arsenic resistance protein [Marivirga sp.]|uniref:arsenic resistance protein n=1 Tax=Marivirga sp. TaxID=2018662 RepID=UPI003DA78176
MGKLEKFQTLIILLAVCLGLLLGQFEQIKVKADEVIVPALAAMLYGIFLSIPMRDLTKAFKNRRFAISSIAINFIWTPILAWILGYFLLSEHPYLWIGFIMLMVTPCTDWYLIFTQIAKGNVVLSTAILPVNLLLQLILLPFYLFLFNDMSGNINLSGIWESIIIILVIPFLLAQLTKSKLLNKNQKISINQRLSSFFTKAQLPFLCLAIAAMFAAQGEYLLENPAVLYLMLIPVLAFFFVNFFFSQIVGRFLKFSFQDRVSLSMTTLARNSPISLAIAITAFPNQPLIALALVIGPLIELPILAIVSQAFLLTKDKK